MMSWITTLADVLTEWALALGGVLGSSVLAFLGYVRRVDRRSKKNERRLEGDPEDPNNEGALNIVAETRRELQEFREETRRDHREVMERIEEMDGDGD